MFNHWTRLRLRRRGLMASSRQPLLLLALFSLVFAVSVSSAPEARVAASGVAELNLDPTATVAGGAAAAYFPAPGSAAAAAPHLVAGLALPRALLSLEVLAAALLPAELGDVPLSASAQPLFPFVSAPAIDDASLSPRDRALLPPRPARETVPLARLAERLGAAGDARFLYYSAQVAEVVRGEVVRAVASPSGRALAAHAAHTAPRNATAQASLWLSSHGACTPLHFDASDNVVSQLSGEKEFTLYPPAAVTAARLLPWASSLQRSARAGLDGAAAAARPLGGHAATVIRLAAGESLFVPAHWLHHVCAGAAGSSLAEGTAPIPDSAPASASASVSVWVTDSEAQRGARALLAAPLPPLPGAWGLRQRVGTSMYLFRALAGSLAGDASAALRSRYSSSENSEFDGPAATRALSDTAAAAAAGACSLSDAEAAELRAGAALEPFLEAGGRALRAQANDAVRVIVLSDYAEAALMRAMGVSRRKGSGDGAGAKERARQMVDTMQACF